MLTIKYLTYAEIAKAARIFLGKYHSDNTLPIPVEEIIEFGMGVDIIPIPHLQKNFDVEGFTSSDLSSICVDDFIFKNRVHRYRFTLAHEVGHISLHADVFSEYQFDSIESWKNFQRRIEPREYSKLEFQGYSFGGLILVPPDHLKNLLSSHLYEITPLITQARDQGLSRDLYLDYAIDNIASILAPLFEVSNDVVTKRIKFDKLEDLIP